MVHFSREQPPLNSVRLSNSSRFPNLAATCRLSIYLGVVCRLLEVGSRLGGESSRARPARRKPKGHFTNIHDPYNLGRTPVPQTPVLHSPLRTTSYQFRIVSTTVSRFWGKVSHLFWSGVGRRPYPWAREIVVCVFEETKVMCTRRPGTECPRI